MSAGLWFRNKRGISDVDGDGEGFSLWARTSVRVRCSVWCMEMKGLHFESTALM